MKGGRARRYRALVVGVVGFLGTLAGSAQAGSVDIKPVRLFLDGRRATAEVVVTNRHERPLSMEISAFQWTQSPNGRDIETPADDIIFFPSMFSVESGQAQVIRIGLMQAGSREVERTYRLYFQELPQSSTEKVTAVSVSLRIGIPLFVAPFKVQRSAVVEELKKSRCRLKAKVSNTGNVHNFWNKISFSGINDKGVKEPLGETTGWYVLGGSAKIFSVYLADEACARVNESSRIHVQFSSDDLSVQGTWRAR